jgi:hypothetical protein
MTNEIPMAGFPSSEGKMPLSFDHSGIQSELEELANAGLYRRLRTICSPQGSRIRLQDRDIINFSSNDYLGLSNSEELRSAMIVGVQRYGVGSGASRLVCGNHVAHEELEHRIAQLGVLVLLLHLMVDLGDKLGPRGGATLSLAGVTLAALLLLALTALLLLAALLLVLLPCSL